MVFISCSSNDEEDATTTFDFGEVSFDEPFVGLLKSRPQILVESLQYPPFSWAAPDTTLIERTFEVTFNEECLRSKSQAIIQFTDEIGTPYSGIDVYCNDTLCPMGKITVKAATDTSKIAHVKLKISPSVIGDSTLTGYVCLQGTELDCVNGTDLQHQREAIALWKCNHELNWPIMLWLLWLICSLLIVATVIFLIYLLCKYIIIPIYKTISSIKLNVRPLHSYKISHNKLSKNNMHNQTYYTTSSLDELYKFYPEMKNVISEICNHSPAYFQKENFIVKRQGDTFSVQYINNGKNTAIALQLTGNSIYAKSGALQGPTNQLNDFLNYPMPNKCYYIDNCFEYKTDNQGRVIEACANLNEAKNIPRYTKGRYPEYPKWVEEMNGNRNCDDGGHLFATRFNGLAEKINIVPMNRELQRPGGDWFEQYERVTHNFLNENKQIRTKINISYDKNSKRPKALKVRTVADTKTVINKTFNNP